MQHSTWYYPLDLAIGFGVPLLLLILRLRGRLDPALWRRFWLGVAVGATWEIPIFVGSCATSNWVSITFLRPPPVAWPVLLVSHTLWDGSLFVLGWWLVTRVVSPADLTRRRPLAVLLFVLYGQVQALAVELSSLLSGGWVYRVLCWNPQLLEVNGQPLTVLPHLFWLWGSLIYLLLWRLCHNEAQAAD